MQKRVYATRLLLLALIAAFSVSCGGKPKKDLNPKVQSQKKNTGEVKPSEQRPGAGLAKNDPDGDEDGDGVKNSMDNCPLQANSDQADTDKNGIGDVCDSAASDDNDGDGKKNSDDNCPDIANADQADKDGDGVGDACDNCPDVSNADQADADADGVGDACVTPPLDPDGDEDGDGIKNSEDKCPLLNSSNNDDFDKDGVGDACDNCPRIPNPLVSGKQPNVCERYKKDSSGKFDTNQPRKDFVPPKQPSETEDTDGDGKKDAEDNCPDVANADQADIDGDGVGDACDICPTFPNPRDYNKGWAQPNYCKSDEPEYDNKYENYIKDSDKDGIPDYKDNCPNVTNADQADIDGDGVGDACDNCPNVPNASQRNSWKPGDPVEDKTTGDACKTFPSGTTCDPSQSNACPDVGKKHQICQPGLLGSGGRSLCVCDSDKADVTTVRPKVMLVLDASGSMEDFSRQGIAKGALDTLVDKYANDVDFGVFFFGDRRANKDVVGGFVYRITSDGRTSDTSNYVEHCNIWGTSCSSNVWFTLSTLVGQYTAYHLKQFWSTYPANGGTPTGEALNLVRTEGYLGNAKNNEGLNVPRVVILMTDGNPFTGYTNWRPDQQDANARKEQKIAVQAAKDLYDSGIPVYVVGINYAADPTNNNTSKLDAVAKAGSGGKKSFTDGSNATQLTKILNDIVKENISCDLKLSNNLEPTQRVFVYMNGTLLDSTSDYTYDPTTRIVKLKAGKCKELKDSTNAQFSAVATCAETCKPSINPKTGMKFTKSDPESDGGIEMCFDKIDNNCNGQVDEDCTGIKREICGDNIDNDNDGVVDNGCPPDKKFGEDCDRTDACIGLNECKDVDNSGQKKCRPLVCHASNQECLDDSDCCAGTKCQPNGSTGKNVCKLLLG